MKMFICICVKCKCKQNATICKAVKPIFYTHHMFKQRHFNISQKYYLILNLMAKTCLKKAGIGTTKCWNDFTSYSIIKRIRECGEIFVFMGQYWTASGLWALRQHRH